MNYIRRTPFNYVVNDLRRSENATWRKGKGKGKKGGKDEDTLSYGTSYENENYDANEDIIDDANDNSVHDEFRRTCLQYD